MLRNIIIHTSPCHDRASPLHTQSHSPHRVDRPNQKKEKETKCGAEPYQLGVFRVPCHRDESRINKTKTDSRRGNMDRDCTAESPGGQTQQRVHKCE